VLPVITVTAITEPMLNDATDSRFSLFPITCASTWALYKNAEASFWTAEEVDLHQDRSDFTNKLSTTEQQLITSTLGFFASADGIVAENLVENFAAEVKLPEARCFYGMQIAMENIHNEMYCLLIDTIVTDPKEKSKLFHAIITDPSVKAKADWALHWCNAKSRSFAERLVAFAAVEGIMFSSSFATIYWFKQRGLMPGLTHSNELIAQDEGIHTTFACQLHNQLTYPTSPATIKDIIVSATLIEQQFVRHAMPQPMLGMNARLMEQYVEFVADFLLGQLHQPKHFHTLNPFEFMNTISLQGKTNFFEKRVSEYAKAGVTADVQDNNHHHDFGLDTDF
jgi:ribonucleoside-diphosphate reductase subunit M2